MFGKHLHTRHAASAVFALALVVALCGLCSCASSAAKNEDLPQLTIGSNNFPPYTYKDTNGEPTGIDVEIATEACHRIGYEPSFVWINWSQRNELLENGTVDCLWGGYPMKGDDDYAWVGPYAACQQVVAVPEDSSIYTLDDLAGKSVAVRISSDAENIFTSSRGKNIPNLKSLVCLRNADDLPVALYNEYVDACAGYAASLIVLFQNSEYSYRFLDENLDSAQLGIAFSQNSDPSLRAALEQAIADVWQDGTMKKILESYGRDATQAFEGIKR